MRNKTVIKICTCAMMAGLAIVLDVLSLKIGNEFKITIYPISIILVSLIYGAGFGSFTGLVTGFISQVIMYGIAPTTPLWIIPYILWGVLPVTFVKLFNIKKRLYLFIPTTLSALFVSVVTSAITVLDGIILGYETATIMILIFGKIGFTLISCVIYYILSYLLVDRLKNITKI